MRFWKQVGLFAFTLVAFGVFFGPPSASAQVCTNVPQYSLLCPSDNVGLTADTSSTLVAEAENCSVPAGSNPKCEYYCDTTHEKSGNTCAFRSDKPLTVTKNGSGRVASSPAGIDCGTTCSARFQNGTSVMLTATPNANATFTGWSGACSGSGTTCTVVMSEKRQITANFSGSSGTCEDTSEQKCSANCETEAGYEAGGTGTCTDTAKSQCCKSKSDSGGGTTTACTGSENAGIVPCGRSCDNPNTADVNEAAVCTLCHLLVLMRNITDWIFMVMTYIAFAVLVAMGILYIVSTGKPQLIGMAKNGIWAALVGFAIVLLGWVAINVLLFVLADGALGTDTANFSVKTNGKWFEYTCDTQTKYTGTGGTGSDGTTPTGPGGNLSCTSGACAKDPTISNAVKSQSYVDSNMYMAVLQAGEHYNQNTTCTKGVSGAGACGYSQVIPSTARAVCGLTCSEIIADVNKDIGCGAKVLADFKKYSMCNLDGIKSLSGCYNSGTSNCTPNSRTINGKCYSCGEGTPPYCDRVSAYYEACK